MPNNQFINLEELSITTQALLSKINEQSNLKVNKHNVSAEYTEGTKIAEIEDVEIYAPIQKIDTSNLVTHDDLSNVAYSGSYNDLNNTPSLATVATSGNYNDLNNKPSIPNVPSWALNETKPTYTANEVGAVSKETSAGQGDSYGYISNTPGTIGLSEKNQGGLSSISMVGPSIALNSNKIRLRTNNVENISLSEGQTTIIGVVTPTSNDMAANKKYVDDSVSAISVPTKTSDLTNDSGYITSYIETDPTVPAWAKAATKPTYTATEVGALPDTYTAPVTSVNEEIGNVIISKIKTTAPSNNVEYNLMGTTSNNNTIAVSPYNQDLLSFAKTTNFSRLTIGSTSMPGKVRLYSSADSASGYTELKSNASSTNAREVTFPDASGTVALTTDIPNVPSWALAASKPSYTFSELTSHPTTLNDYGITNAYTKTEVDGLVSGVLHYKGTKSATGSLPNSGNVIGDVWHITADGSEWAWDGSDWQELGTAVDLSGYLQTGDIAAWAKAANKPSYTASEVGALPSSTSYVSSFNGATGAITYTPPVTSVNGNTGAVTITAASITAASATHAHGNLTSGGDITTTATIASGDRLVINDESASKITNSSITFGTSTTQYLANNGTWQNLPTVSVSQTLTSGTEIGSVNNTKLYAPTPYNDSALAARVTALEQLEWATYYSGRSNPSNSQGQNGDIYLQY